MRSERRLAVIMFTDIVGYTALMGRDEQQALEILKNNREVHRPLIEEYRGRWLKEMGDGILASFESTSGALKCAAQIISTAAQRGIQLRIGIHLGEVVFEGGDVFGDGVNIASRLEAMAAPGSVLFTDKVHDDIRNKPDFKAVSLGARRFKNVDRPMEIWALDAPGLTIPASEDSHGMSPPAPAQHRTGVRPNTWLVAIIAVVLLVMLGRQLFFSGSKSDISPQHASPFPEMATLAALPFDNIVPDSNSDFLGFALVDQVISALSYVQNISVRPSSSIRKYSNEVVDPLRVADELSVQFVLMGHYVKDRDSVRLNLELIDVNSNKVLWTGTVQEQMSDVFKLQDLVAKKVVDGLKIQFSQAERNRMVKDVPSSALAYEYYLRAVAAPSNVDGNELALELLQKSVELDSTFAPTFSEIGRRVYSLASYSLMGERLVEYDRAIEAFNKSLDLNRECIDALGNLSIAYTELNQMGQALRVSRRILEINPNSAWGHFSTGYVYRFTGFIDLALENMETAVRIDPKNSMFRSIAITYNMAGRYQDALASLHYDDGSGFMEAWHGVTYIRMKDLKNASAALTEAVSRDPESALNKWCQGLLVCAKQQKWSDGLREEILAVEKTIEDPEAMYLWGLVNVMQNDFAGFNDLFEKAVDHGYYPYPAFRIDPILDPIRNDPEFQRIMARAKRRYEDFRAAYL